jgi:hypothetical protein
MRGLCESLSSDIDLGGGLIKLFEVRLNDVGSEITYASALVGSYFT